MVRHSLFEPSQLGAISVKNRIIMAPMTRARGTLDRLPTPLMAEYYAQRASAGLIISEGIIPEPSGRGYLAVPGIYEDAQIEEWRSIVAAVHEKGGKIVAQIMHTGRVSHTSFLDGAAPVAPSAIAAKGEVFTLEGMQAFSVPVALTETQILQIIKNYGIAAKNAVSAGFDGVEIHGASGYLPNQFLASNANHRTDTWGGSLEARARFILAVIDEAVAMIGAARVGVRVSPGFGFNDIEDADPTTTHTYLAKEFSKRDLAYVHVINLIPELDALGIIRSNFKGSVIANGAYTKGRAQDDLTTGRTDYVSFGEAFIANPDLPERLQHDLPLAMPDRATFYTPGPRGYTDYPAYS